MQAYDAFDEFVVGHIRSSGLPFLEMRPIVQERFGEGVYYDEVHLDVEGHIVYGNAIAKALAPLLTKAD